MRARVAMLLALVALASPASAQAPGAAKKKGKIPYETYTLKNGLQVILHEDHRLPQVTVNLWYHVGAANERAGRSGFAHLFEHMMFQGSRHVGDDQHFAIVEEIGGRGINATTNFDRTNYFETVPRNQLETALWLESDRMGFLTDTLDRAKLDTQRDVVRNERRQRTDNRPYGKADERVYQLLFPAPHPYHGVVIGSHEDLQAATVDDVKDFFRTYYAPGNASLVVAGDFDPARARELIETYFGSLPAAEAPPKNTAAVQAPPAAEQREALTDAVQLGRVTIAWVGPPSYSAGEPELDLAASLLGGSKSSLLYKKLVYEKKLAQSVSCGWGGLTLGSALSCEVTAKDGVALADLEKEVDAVLDELRQKGPAAADLSRAKARYKAAMLRALESAAGRADRLNRYNHFTGDPGWLEKDLARYQAVTAASMKTQVAKWLDPKKRVVVTVTPQEKK